MKKHNKETTLIFQWVTLNSALQEILNEKIEDLNSVDDEAIATIANYLFSLVQHELIEVDDETLNGVIVAHFTAQIDYGAIAYKLICEQGIDIERWFNSL